MDRGLYGGMCKHIIRLPLRFSRSRDAAGEMRTAVFVYLNGGLTLQGTAHRGSLHPASLCVSCLAPTLNVTEIRFHSYRDHQPYRRHKGHAFHISSTSVNVLHLITLVSLTGYKRPEAFRMQQAFYCTSLSHNLYTCLK